MLAWPLQIPYTSVTLDINTQPGGIMSFKVLQIVIRVVLCVTVFSVGVAHADLNAYLQDLNVAAQGDIGDFKAKLQARFGTSSPQLEVVLDSVGTAADAAMVLWLGEQSHQPVEKVLHVYKNQDSRSWGALAKSLGIKPGSQAFHDLKNGNVQIIPGDSHGDDKSKGKGNGKHKSKNKKKHS